MGRAYEYKFKGSICINTILAKHLIDLNKSGSIVNILSTSAYVGRVY